MAPHGGTIPPDILVTTLRPDIFLVNESSSTIIMVELTCPYDSNIVTSHTFKSEKYAPLVADLSRRFRVQYYPVEISVHSQLSREAK